MNNYYFTYLMQEHGKKNVENLISDILKAGNIKDDIKSFNLNDWNFLYFYSVYFSIALNHLGIDKNIINFCLDMVIAPGWSELFKLEKEFKLQKNNIPKIEKLVDEEFKKHHN